MDEPVSHHDEASSFTPSEKVAQIMDARIVSVLERITDGFVALDHKWRYSYVTPLSQLQGAVVSHLDITERRQAEEALLTSEERLRLALEAGDIGVWDWDVQQNALTWSERVYELHGVSKETFAVTFENFLKLVHSEDKLRVQKAIGQALQAKVPYHINCRVVTPQGEIRWLTTTARVIYDAAGKPIRMLGATSDITLQKALEQQKDDFISIASHELKTPITSLKGMTRLTKRMLEKQGAQEPIKYLSKMEAQINNLTRLIDELLDGSKIQAGKLDYTEEFLDINALVQDLVEILQQINPTHVIQVSGSTDKRVVGDGDRLGQVFTNLITNAVKYSPQANKVEVNISSSQDFVVVSVRDYGVGISKEHQSKIFDRFYRVPGAKGRISPGLGMGLYISSEIVTRHGGVIRIYSEEGKGSIFSVSLRQVDARQLMSVAQ